MHASDGKLRCAPGIPRAAPRSTLRAMISGQQSTDVRASAQTVFAVASDLERYPEWQDFLQRVSVRERDAASRAELVEAHADAKLTALKLMLR